MNPDRYVYLWTDDDAEEVDLSELDDAFVNLRLDLTLP